MSMSTFDVGASGGLPMMNCPGVRCGARSGDVEPTDTSEWLFNRISTSVSTVNNSSKVRWCGPTVFLRRIFMFFMLASHKPPREESN